LEKEKKRPVAMDADSNPSTSAASPDAPKSETTSEAVPASTHQDKF
jgi:hypothetical protein